MGEIAEFRYGYTATATNNGKFRYIRITDIDEFGEIAKKDKKYIDLSNKEDQDKYLLKEGDIIVARIGSVGKTTLFESEEKCIFASYLIRINLDKEIISPKYYWYFTKSQEYWEQVNNSINEKGTSQPQFNANSLKEIIVPIPSLEKQQEIIKEWEENREEINKQKQSIKYFQERKRSLLNKLW